MYAQSIVMALLLNSACRRVLVLFLTLFFHFTAFAVFFIRLALFAGTAEGAARAVFAFLFEFSATFFLSFLFPTHSEISSDRSSGNAHMV